MCIREGRGRASTRRGTAQRGRGSGQRVWAKGKRLQFRAGFGRGPHGLGLSTTTPLATQTPYAAGDGGSSNGAGGS